MTLSELAQQWRDQTDGQSTGWLLATLQHARELEAWIAAQPAAQDTRPAGERERWEAVVIDAFHKWEAVQRTNDRNTNGILGAVWMPWDHIRERLLKSDLRAAMPQPLPASTPEES